jgi:arabinogalactan endo-1,4-beta-galactosidase
MVLIGKLIFAQRLRHFPLLMDGKVYWHSTKNNNGKNVARIGNEKHKNIMVLENLQTPTWKT